MPTPRNLIILFMQIIILVIISISYVSLSPLHFDTKYISLILTLVFISLVIYALRAKTEVLKKNYLTISFLFLISYFVVHFQLYVDYIFSLRDELGVRYYLDYKIVPKAITIAAIGLVCYLIGIIFQSLVSSKNNSPTLSKPPKFSMLFLIALMLFSFALFLLVTPSDYFMGNYGEYTNSNKISYLQEKLNQFTQVSIWAYIICYVINQQENNKKIRTFPSFILQLNFAFLIITSTYCLLTLSAGSRGPVIKIFLLLLIGYIIGYRKKVNILFFLVLIAVAGYIMEFVSYFRNVDGSLDLTTRFNEALKLKAAIKSNSNQSTFFPPTLELAESLGVYQAVVMHHETNQLLYGSTIISPIIGIIPGLGALISSAFSIELETSAQYITDALGTPYGTGTTAVADIYTNFGVLGVAFIFTFFGAFVSKLDKLAYTNFYAISLFYQTTFMIFAANAIYMGRSSIFGTFSEVILVYIFISLSIIFRKLFA